ncbi:MAG: hypothetical protein WCJ29_04260 [bacterium]
MSLIDSAELGLPALETKRAGKKQPSFFEFSEAEMHETVAQVNEALADLDDELLTRLEANGRGPEAPEALRMAERVEMKRLLREGKVIGEFSRVKPDEIGRSETRTAVIAYFESEQGEAAIMKSANGDGMTVEGRAEPFTEGLMDEEYENKLKELTARWLDNGIAKRNSRGELRASIRQTLYAGEGWRGEVLVPAIAEVMGIANLVPATVLRSDLDGAVPVTLQKLEPYGENAYRDLRSLPEDTIQVAAILDYLVKQSDRHGGNLMWARKKGPESERELTLIDHAYSFVREIDPDIGKDNYCSVFMERVMDVGDPLGEKTLRSVRRLLEMKPQMLKTFKAIFDLGEPGRGEREWQSLEMKAQEVLRHKKIPDRVRMQLLR